MAEPDLSYEAFTRARNAPAESGAPEGEVRTEQAPSAPDAEAAPDLSYRAYQKSKGITPQEETDRQILPPDVAGALAGSVPGEEEGQAPGAAPQVSPHAGRGWFQTLTSSIHRGVGELGLVPETLGAVAAEASGHEDVARGMMENVEAKSRALPQAEWNLGNIHSLGDFGYWLTERFGENAPALVTMLGTGGVGGVLSVLGRSGLSNAAKAALIRGGQMAGTYAAAAPLSVAGVAQEQFGATGSTQPGVSTLAGLGGAALQTYLPFKLLSHELGPGFWNSVGKGAAIGAGFGSAQEAVNIMARKYTDPDYSYAGDGPTRIGWGQRFYEALATNAALGGAMGPLGRKGGEVPPGTRRFRPEAEVPGMEPGTRGEVPPEGAPPGGPGGPGRPGGPAEMPSMEMPWYGWHGTPHDVVGGFRPEAIGTGEGFAAYEKGFYMGGAQETGEHYARALYGRRLSTEEMTATSYMTAADGDSKEALAQLKDSIEMYEQGKPNIFNREQIQKLNGAVQLLEQGWRPKSRHGGNLYHVEVDADPEHVIHWDKTLEEQDPGVLQKIKDNFLTDRAKKLEAENPEKFNEDFLSHIRGNDFLQQIKEGGVIFKGVPLEPGEQPRDAISRALSAAGLRGIEYFDRGSRGKQEGTTNLVVFKEHADKIKLLTKNGEPVPEDEAAYMKERGTPPERPEGIEGTKGGFRPAAEGPGMMRLGGPRVDIAPLHRGSPEAPKETTGATAPEPGPVTRMRRELIQKPIDPDRGVIESTMGVNGDAFGAAPLLRSVVDHMQGQEQMLDLIEQNVPRYAVEDPSYPSGYHPRLLTNTDVEKTGVERPQAEKARTWEIDQNSLQPAGITADVTDLPPHDSPRIWFLSGTTPEERVRLYADYINVQRAAEQARPAMQFDRPMEQFARQGDPAKGQPGLEQIYHDLVSKGLRVIPSHGSSFFYDGTFQARRAEVTTTGRTKQLVFMDAESGVLQRTDMARNHMTQTIAGLEAAGLPNVTYVPMALDVTKFKPGEVMGVPGTSGGAFVQPLNMANKGMVKFREGLSPRKQNELLQRMSRLLNEGTLAWMDASKSGPLVAEARQLMREGAWIEPTVDSLAVVTRDPIQLDRLTPGVFRWENKGAPIREAAFLAEPSTVHLDREGMPLTHLPMAAKLRFEAAKMLPLVDSILDKLGIKANAAGEPGRIGVEIKVGGPDWHDAQADPTSGAGLFNPATAHVESGTIALHTAGFRGLTQLGLGFGAMRSRLYTVLMHEVGHFVTYHMVTKAPPEVQQLLAAGYEKYLLDNRLDPEVGRARGEPAQVPGSTTLRTHVGDYYLTYSEWLAEQFRRWAGSNVEPKTELERQYKKVAGDMERFYSMWEKAFPDTFMARDMTEPTWHFSAAMHYWRAYGDRSPGAAMRQLMASQALHMMGDVQSNPTTDAVLHAGPLQAMREMARMFPPGVQKVINNMLNPAWGKSTPGALGRSLPAWVGSWTHPLIELAVGALPRALDVRYSRVFYAHELVHVHRMLGLIQPREWNLLTQAARDAGIVFEAKDAANLRARIEEYGNEVGWTRAERDRLFESARQEEMVAQYIEKFANNEPLAEGEAKGVAKLYTDFMTRIRNLLQGQGFNTREAVLRRFFNGEMAQRPQREQAKAMARTMGVNPPITPQSIKTVEGLPHIAVAAQEVNLGDEYPRHIFKFYDNAAGNVKSAKDLARAKLLGWVTLEQEEKGLHISYIKSTGDRFFMMKTMLQHIERELGETALPASEFTEEGYKMARLQYREQLKHYIWVDAIKRWVSPNFVREQTQNALDSGDRTLRQFWQNVYNKVPKATWRNKILDQMFMMPREWMRDAVQETTGAAGRAASEGQLRASVGDPSAQAAPDPFTAANDRQMQETQAKNARELGVPFGLGAPQMPSMEMRRIDNWLVNQARAGVERVTGFREGPEARGELTGVVNEADRIGHFTKYWWDIQQLLWNNDHIMGLRTYVGGSKMWSRFVSMWQSRAENGVRNWNQLPAEGRDRVGRLMFWESEMQYRTPNEVLNRVRRHPTTAELAGQMAREGFTADDAQVYNQLKGDFTDYLREAEQRTIDRAQARITNPAQLAARIGEIRTEYNEIREKPYFPHTRFGRWTIVVRDVARPNQPVIESYAYDTRGQRDAALDGVRGANPGQRVTYGTAPDNVGEFMGLPGPLLREIKSNLPGLTRAQMDWIEEFEHLHAPDRTFRRRWLPQNSMPGYSMDAMRAYSSFFISGANYLARLVHAPILEQGIQEVRDSLRTQALSNTAKRQEILKYLEGHYRYMSEPGRDWGKTKAFISLWQLAFSPAAAFTNLLQTPVTTLPHLMGHFGNMAGFSYMSRALSRGTRMPGNYDLAHATLENEGLINIGQAADVAMYAQGNNMQRSLAGSAAELAWRSASYYGMWMYQKAEELNREITARASWLAAMENPNQRRVQEVAMLYPREMGELTTSGMTYQEAAAYLFTKETIEGTQGNYTKWNRSPFLRSQLGQVALIFFKYTQNMVELYRLSPGRLQMAMLQAALFGVAGLPGAEDINQVLRSVGHTGVWLLRQLGINYFGKDFDLLDQARQYARQFTKGTAFDKVGPDLLLHGISRYGFGLGLLPEGMALGQFDASANGSLGKIVPGLQEGLRGLMFGDYKSGVSDVAARAAGAGYGWLFTMMKYMSEDPGTFDSKTWEGLLPRVGRQMARAARFANNGLTTRQGGQLVKFDMADPEDIGAVAAQLAGYTPTKVSQVQEAQRDMIERQMQLKMEKTMLYGQLDKAIEKGDPRVISDVVKAITEYNEQVIPEDPTQAIQMKGLLASLKRRQQQRAMQGALQQPGAVNRGSIPMYQKILENYPGIVVDKRRIQGGG